MQKVKKYSYLVAYLFVLLPLMGFYFRGVFFFAPLIIIFGITPFIDHFLNDPTNPTDEQDQKLSHILFYKVVLILYVPLQLSLLAFYLYQVSVLNLSTLEFTGLILSVGILMSGGVGIAVSHELVHKRDPLLQFLSKILLSTVCYGHFYIEHPRGHHVKVGTPDDPATARLNESFYRFYVRALVTGFISAWKLEKQRLSRFNYHILSWRNQFWWIILGPVSIFTGIYFVLGEKAALFFILQSIAGFTLVELVNYIEHYGLVRKQLKNGRYERPNPAHSWNANKWLSNVFIFQLQRHSDHHSRPEVPYQALKHIDQSPQLPTGYTGMLLVALIPPLWFYLMNPRAQAYESVS